LLFDRFLEPKIFFSFHANLYFHLFEDLEEYAATTGAMLASMQGQLKRWNTGGDNGNKHGGQF